MPPPSKTHRSSPFAGSLLLLLGCLVIGFGWLLPSRFKSVPFGVVREAGQGGESVVDLAKARFLDGNLGAASLLGEAAQSWGLEAAALVNNQVAMELEANAQVARWGVWDPFLDAALRDVPLGAYSNEPGALGILIAEPCRNSVARMLESSRDPMVKDILETGEYTTYKRLFPVSSTSGRPLEVTLLGLALMAQGDHLQDGIRRELRELIWEARATGNVGLLEDFYLDSLSLMRIFDWGQLTEIYRSADSLESIRRLRYLLHRRPEHVAQIYSMAMSGSGFAGFLDYLAQYGDDGFSVLERSLAEGIDGFRLAIREQLPVELSPKDQVASFWEDIQNAMAPFSLKNPQLSLGIKYGSFFIGSFLALFGLSLFGGFYRESVSPLLAYTQRFFGATASVVVFAVLSEPYLAKAGSFEGYSFRLVMPVLAQVDGELQIIETTPTTNMETATLLSIAFFFLLQALVFLICMLKVREIERRELQPLVKLKLMENEENLFDSGLYVGIAGTCIALVMQVIGIVEANLLAAYSSNLFGILCVAIVKIRLVRPYKTKLIMAGQDQLLELASK